LQKDDGQGCTKCVFCGYHETIDHLFISYSFARPVWRVVHFTYNIPPTTSVNNLFANWLNGIDKQTKAEICVGVCTLVWAIWNCHNDVVFNWNSKPIFLKVINTTADKGMNTKVHGVGAPEACSGNSP
jgi:hypothetical protein